MKTLLACISILALASSAELSAQINHASDSTLYRAALENASGKSLRIQKAINIGSEYHEIPYTITNGHPFLLSDKPLTGEIHYNDIVYKNLAIQYDLIHDEIITEHANGWKIILIKEKISEFTIDGHLYQRFPGSNSNDNIKPGFYNILVNNESIRLLAKREKQIKGQGNHLSYQVEPGHIEEKTDYYLEKEGHLFHVKNHKAIIRLLSDKKRGTYVRAAKEKDEEAQMISVVKQYISSKDEL